MPEPSSFGPPAEILFPRKPSLLYLLHQLPAGRCRCSPSTVSLSAIPRVYHTVAACGLFLGVVSAFAIARTWSFGRGWWILRPVLYLDPHLVLRLRRLLSRRSLLLLFVLYFATAVVFQLSLPRKSLGKVAIVLGFAVWSLVFLFHSWVTNIRGYDAIADEIWNLQKFLVTIGMLLVLLEQQVSTNEWYAFHDHLTGLPNQRLFEDRLAAAIRQSQRNNTRTALLMVDLDGFKLINDTHGHDVGDELLRHIAHNLRGAIRAPDTLARLGGDEFIIIATDLPSDQPADLIARPARPASPTPCASRSASTATLSTSPEASA